MEKQLKEKAISIKGKDYILVSDRVLYLSEKYEGKYSIETDYQLIDKMFICKAKLTIGDCVYTGLAQEIIGDGYINKTSALENCETSAVGRACAMAGIGVIDSIASIDELNKAKNREYIDQKTGEIKKLPAKKPWLNEPDLDKEKPAIVEMLSNGVSGDEILASLSAKYNISKAMTEKLQNGFKNIS